VADIFQGGSDNGSRDAAESDDEDDAYWSQYDQFNGPAGGNNLPKDGTTEQDETSYYERYNEVETAVAGDSAQPDAPDVTARNPHGSEPTFPRGNEVNEAMEDYIRATVRNLQELAERCGISQTSFKHIINEEMTK
jgi:hypothetical protein